jgi:hypothetical protein
MANIGQFEIDVENEAQEAQSFDALPDGNYPAIATASELKDTKLGNGKYLAVTFEIIDGDFRCRKLWANLNIVNPSAQAEKIGRAELASLCKAIGVVNPKESEELHDTPVMLTVRKDKADPTRNVIKGYAPVGDAFEVPVAKPAPKAAASAAKPAATGKKPWQK